MSINSVSISGNLTRDAEVRQTATGTLVASIPVAVNDRRKNQSGEWEDHPNYIDCVMFGTRAEKIAPYLSRGTKVSISGRLSQSSCEKDGQRRSKVEVVVGEIEFMSRGDRGERRQQQVPVAIPAASDVYDSDIPF